MSNDTRIGLADALTELRREINEAVERARDPQGIKLELKDIEVEFQLVAEQKDIAQGKGTIGFSLFGGEASYSDERGGSKTHTLKFRLDPKDETGKSLNLGRSG